MSSFAKPCLCFSKGSSFLKGHHGNLSCDINAHKSYINAAVADHLPSGKHSRAVTAQKWSPCWRLWPEGRRGGCVGHGQGQHRSRRTVARSRVCKARPLWIWACAPGLAPSALLSSRNLVSVCAATLIALGTVHIPLVYTAWPRPPRLWLWPLTALWRVHPEQIIDASWAVRPKISFLTGIMVKIRLGMRDASFPPDRVILPRKEASTCAEAEMKGRERLDPGDHFWAPWSSHAWS